MKTALFWHTLEGGKIQCELCPQACRLADGQSGVCRVRRAEDGELKAAAYGCLSSANLDPIEKKPLYHFMPGRSIFSVGGWGCNLACSFCQNWTISQQFRAEGNEYAPLDVVRAASRDQSCGVAYTYNEPIVGFEFVQDCARLARERNLKNVLVTNGYCQPEPAAELLPLIDAVNVDIKSMDDGFYRSQCHGSLAPVLAFTRRAFETGCHVEVTNLIIPGLNDTAGDAEALAGWIARELSEHVPLHLSAYRPMYKLTIPATPVDTLERAFAVCRQRLQNVYLGNTFSEVGRDTVCEGCRATLIRRQGYRTEVVGLSGSACAACGRQTAIVVR